MGRPGLVRGTLMPWHMSITEFVLVARTPSRMLELAPMSPEAAARRDWARFQELLVAMQQVAERERAARGQMRMGLEEADND